MSKKKILLLSDDLRMTSGIATVSKEFVFGTVDRFDWVQLAAAVKHPEQGKIVDISNKLTEDINEMEKMLNEYLQFTSSSYVEKDEMFNLSELISEVVEKYNNENISQNSTPRVYFNGRKNLINRCLNNLIDNAIKYATKVEISLNKKNSNLFIIIDDNGPGISKKEYENVFKPFYKIDKGRADSKSSVGLGLSISSDIIKSHGGNIMLERSKMNGLRVKIFLPV